MKRKAHHNYQDDYFEKGHWGIKLWQTLIALLSWCVLFTPIIITSATYLAYRTHGQRGHLFWNYAEGFRELNFLCIFLAFSLGMIAVFCLAMGYIQHLRSRGLVEKWPMFDLTKSNWEQSRAEAFMTNRFGPRVDREKRQRFKVTAEQNLAKNQLKEIINGNRMGENE
ncbi:ABC transporter permease [Limosilactobacillus sp. STM2_1]|uniref:ABC transporter permease n=1 Tax=Limosilactobacillus rudii TaxID=2759755 RepID=A0A7W3YNE9_9LACO|nr:ABC transporter permease [Limosilactobacillus rudii]MBB1079514.1 ABC transporter permease [Limosilactobacillus rudii]MBB1097560.1 ABC transporter permease [Limosilactobacillus rudii]MCD7134669.1 ABC transporter permease [Limosilactobacillus rudii]